MQSFLLDARLALAIPLLPVTVVSPVAFAAEGKLILTGKSVVLLDGKPVAFADVPVDAVVVKLEVAADMKTIVRVEFRSK